MHSAVDRAVAAIVLRIRGRLIRKLNLKLRDPATLPRANGENVTRMPPRQPPRALFHQPRRTGFGGSAACSGIACSPDVVGTVSATGGAGSGDVGSDRKRTRLNSNH